MGNGMNKILDGIYIGNLSDSKDRNQIDQEKITHILTIINYNCEESFDDIEYLKLDADDVPGQQLTQFFAQGVEFIHKARVSGGNVLVHCAAGVSRSVTMVVVYIVTITHLDWQTALNVVRACRSRAHPNMGFQKQLAEWSSDPVQVNKCRNIILRYPALQYNDKEKCKELLAIYQKKEEERRRRNIPKAMDYELPVGAYKATCSGRSEEEKPAAVLGRDYCDTTTSSTTETDGRRVSIMNALRVIIQAKVANLRKRKEQLKCSTCREDGSQGSDRNSGS